MTETKPYGSLMPESAAALNHLNFRVRRMSQPHRKAQTAEVLRLTPELVQKIADENGVNGPNLVVTLLMDGCQIHTSMNVYELTTLPLPPPDPHAQHEAAVSDARQELRRARNNYANTAIVLKDAQAQHDTAQERLDAAYDALVEAIDAQQGEP